MTTTTNNGVYTNSDRHKLHLQYHKHLTNKQTKQNQDNDRTKKTPHENKTEQTTETQIQHEAHNNPNKPIKTQYHESNFPTHKTISSTKQEHHQKPQHQEHQQ